VQRRSLPLVLLFALVISLALSGAVFGQGEKAVIVVGPVDPPENYYTNSYIAEAETVARILEDGGYAVSRLYHPRATWERVVEESRGAAIFVYYGHGNGYGWYGLTDNRSTNGLCLSDPDNPDKTQAGPGARGGSGADLRNLALAPGALVALFHACYAAGSTQYDRQAADYDTASTRVQEYAQAFFAAGAGEYVATSYVGLAPEYFKRLVNGESAERAFLAETSGQRLHNERGMLLLEDLANPRDPQPWAAAFVERPVQIALAAPQPAPKKYRQAAAEEQQTSRFRNVMIPATAPEGDEGNEMVAGEWNWGRSLHQGSDWELSLQNVFLRSLDRRHQGSGEHLNLWQLG
jgi:hypothetical protein